MARNFVAASSQNLYSNVVVLAATAFPCTFHGWYRPASLEGFILHTETVVSTNWRAIGITGAGKLRAQERQADGTPGHAESVGVLTAGVWSACGGVFTNAASRACFLDGVKATDTTAITLADTFDKTYVGGRAGIFADGDLAEVACWNVGLSDAEMVSLAKGFCPTLIRPAGLVAYWPLFGNDSPEPDRWKNRNDLTLANAPVKGNHPPMYYPTGVL